MNGFNFSLRRGQSAEQTTRVAVFINNFITKFLNLIDRSVQLILIVLLFTPTVRCMKLLVGRFISVDIQFYVSNVVEG